MYAYLATNDLLYRKVAEQAMKFLLERKQEIDRTLKAAGPYAYILVNVVGTGPWFDAYVPNFTGMASGEFTPGKRTK